MKKSVVIFIGAVVLITFSVIGGFVIASDDAENKPKQNKPTYSAPPLAPQGDLQPPAGEPSLQDSTPEAVPDAELEAGRRQTDRDAAKLRPEPVGGAQLHSCGYRPAGNSGSRGGKRITEFVVHYAVFPNIRGWRDVFGVRNYMARAGASSTYIIDFEGHCLQMVRESRAPYTQLSANPYAVSVEIIATGRESRAAWNNSALIKRGILASLMRDSMRKNGLPRRFVNPRGCYFIPGWTDHASLECRNSHTDVRPNFPYNTVQRQLNHGVVVGCASRRTRQIAAKLDYHRKQRNRYRRGTRKWRIQNGHVASWERTARGRRAGLRARGHTLKSKGKAGRAAIRREKLACRTAVLSKRIK